MNRNQGGFTLVEMMVTIVIGSLVTLAATTVLLLGLRINNRSTQTVVKQNTARVVITMLENLAAEGEIVGIETDDDGSWRISNAKDVILAQYDVDTATIYSSSARDPEGNASVILATPLLEDVSASAISLDKSGLLSISVTTDDIDYNSSIYCRTMRAPKKEETKTENEITAGEDYVVDATKVGRTAFLNALASQYRLKGGSPNPGLILDGGFSTGEYYSEWYVGGYNEVEKPGWDIETPWCACFVSWGLCHDTVREKTGSWNIEKDTQKNITGGVAFANVDFFANYFKNPTAQQGQRWETAVRNDSSCYIPTPGDIIFIDWSGEQKDPAHVGVVLKVETKTEGDKVILDSVYTIEGNRENRVMVCKYDVDENYNIVMGYGIIDWKE